jgi:hypothetical protein
LATDVKTDALPKECGSSRALKRLRCRKRRHRVHHHDLHLPDLHLPFRGQMKRREA